ncbi:efflux RND transporter permease subunit [bacterium]|nr:efflux RND transporter permease subunit [bacterium]
MNFTQLLHLSVFGLILIMAAKHLPGFTIRRPVAFIMILGVVALAGVTGIKQLPIELMPDIAYGNVTIFVEVRGGMPPPEVERLVTKPIEAVMGTVSKIKNIISSSKKHKAVITLEFEPGTNMDLAALEVREKFLRVKAKLPREIERPIIAHYEESDAPVVIAALTSSRHTPEEMRRMVEGELKEKLLRLPGTANIEIGGGRERKILAELDKHRLAALGIPIKKITAILEQNNLNLHAGNLEGRTYNLGLRTLGAFQSLEEISNIGIAVGKKGGIIRLKDVARVKDDYLEPETHSRLNSRAAVTIYVQKESLANTIRVVSGVRRVLREFESRMETGMDLIIVTDQARTIQQAVRSVKMTLFYGACLVIIILGLFLSQTVFTRWLAGGLLILLLLNLLTLYFLRIPLESSLGMVIGVLGLLFCLSLWRGDLRPAMIVGCSVPVSLLITLALMYFENVSLNVISLAGLVLGIGLLVDNSIVVLENIDRWKRKLPDMDGPQRVEIAAREMVPAMVGGTLTTVVVFLPFALLQKQTQLLYAGIAFTVTATLFSSLFCALALVPALGARLQPVDNRRKRTKPTRPWTFPWRGRPDYGIKKLLRRPVKILRTLAEYILRRIITIGWPIGLLITVLFALLLYFKFKLEWPVIIFLSACGTVIIPGIFMFRHYSANLRKVLQHKGKTLIAISILFCIAVFVFIQYVPKDFMAASEQSEFVVYVEMASGTRLDICDRIVREVEKRISGLPEIRDMIKSLSSRVEGWSSKIYVSLKPRAERRFSTQEVIDNLRERFKGVGEDHDTFVYFSEPRSGKEIFIEIYGYNYETLAQLAMRIASGIGKIPKFTDVKIRYRPGRPEVRVMLDTRRTAMLGFNHREIGEVMHAQLRGLRATSFYHQEEEIETIVRLKPEQCRTIGQLKNLGLVSPAGFSVPVEHISRLEFGLSPSEIWHRNKTRMIQVSANLGLLPLGLAAKRVQAVIAQVDFPEDYYADIGGDYESMVQANRSFWQAMVMTILLVFVVMACLFESLRQPLIIMITVLLAGIGAVAGLVLTASAATLGVSIGLLMLGGIVVNNGIILVDRINAMRKKSPHVRLEKIVIRAGHQRLRPILMTTITTVLGLLPMALDRSESAVLWSPLALTVIGGLIASTVLTLFVIPCIYIIEFPRWPVLDGLVQGKGG